MKRYWINLLIILILATSIIKGINAQKVIDNTVDIGPLQYYNFSFTTKVDNVDIKVSITVVSGPAVDLLLLDQENFELFQTQMDNNLEYNVNTYIGVQSVKSYDGTVKLGPAGVYYLVLINWDTSKSSTVKVLVEGIEEGGLGSAAFIVVAAVVIIIAFLLIKKRE